MKFTKLIDLLKIVKPNLTAEFLQEYLIAHPDKLLKLCGDLLDDAETLEHIKKLFN